MMDYLAAMQLLASRSPAASREAAKTIIRLRTGSPVAAMMARRLIAAGLADPEAELDLAERDALAALLTGGDDSMPSRPRTSLNVTGEQMAALRDLAASLGLVITRGPGAGEIGNVSALMARLAESHRAAPTATHEAISEIITPTP